MNTRRSTIFRRLAFAIVGTGLLATVVSGMAHYVLAAQLSHRALRSEMQTALQAALSFFETTYTVPTMSGLGLLDNSPAINELLMSVGTEQLLTRPPAEQLMRGITRSHRGMFASLRLVNSDGLETLIVDGEKRVRRYRKIAGYTGDEPLLAASASLFEELSNTQQERELRFEGPYRHQSGTYRILVAMAKREPEIGGFGGAIIAELDLSRFLDYLANLEVMDRSIVWLFAHDGERLLNARDHTCSFNPYAQLFGDEPVPEGAIIEHAPHGNSAGPINLFRLALSISPSFLATQWRGAGVFTVVISLLLSGLLAVVALVLARQLARPIREIATTATAISHGDLEAEVCERGVGELGQTAIAINRMIRSLKQTTVSKVYLDNIIESMSDCLMVLRDDGTVDRVNRALLALLGYREEELVGRTADTILGAEQTRRILANGDDNLSSLSTGVETMLLDSNNDPISVWLSSAELQDHQGQRQGVVCVAQDIRERKKLSALLSQTQAMAKVGGWEVDLRDSSVSWTREVYRIHDLPEDTTITLEQAINYYHPEYRARIRRAVERGIELGNGWDLELKLVTAKCREIWVRAVGHAYQCDGRPTRLAGTFQDITERKLAEQALRVSESRLRTLYDNTPSMFFTVAPDGKLLSVNHFGAAQLGYTVEQLVDRPFTDLYPESDRAQALEHVYTCLDEPSAVRRWELQKMCKNQSLLWVRETGRSFVDVQGNTAVLVVCEDVTEARALSEQLSYQASHDSLTGLFNRREFELRLEQALRSAKAERIDHAVCFLDLDQFKIINDTCGHVAGDELLRQVGALLQGMVRRADTIARLGGDEFGILMEYCSVEHALKIGENLRSAIEAFRFVWEAKSFAIGVSIGLVPLSENSAGINIIMSAADTACYAAKDEGRNRIHVYREDDVELARRHGEMQWVARIQQALEEDRFRLYGQPIVPLTNSHGGLHYELLLRMTGEDGQLIAPGAFLPAAERFNLGSRIDRWVVDSALTWLSARPKHVESLFLCAINLSGQSLGDKGLLESIAQQLQESGVPPEKICFEITETAAIANLSTAMGFIRVLKELGCRFALDDFGSGLSSFAYLKNLPIDFLKIDGLFVKDMLDDPVNLAMVRSINEIGKVMGKETIAEFVENDDILETLREIGVDYAQGHGVGQPKPLDTFCDTEPVRTTMRRRA